MSLEDLLKRVESATGPDRELDHAILDVLVAPEQPVVLPGGIESKGRGYRVVGNVGTPVGADPYVTSSIEAALALVEEKLPGCDIDIYRCDSPLWACELAHPSTASHSAFGCASPCIAVLSALLRALISQKEGVE